MSRNQLALIVGVILVLGVAFQRSPAALVVSSAPCPFCSWWFIQLPGEIGAGGGDLRPGIEREPEWRLEDWIATPTPLPSPPAPTAVPQDVVRSRYSDCLNC